MSYTPHGHHVPGTGWENQPTTGGALCGGPRDCPECKVYVERFVGTPMNWPEEAKRVLFNHIKRDPKKDGLQSFEVYVVMCAKILQHWKGTLATTMADGMYYEVTYDGDKKCWYVDDYPKALNTVYQA